ncbi:MAG: hypothetical protein EBX37_10355, partial [Alphaproteobacteria bacterium]|nr:hypothetical protein [Alphaproteobacteria bacterium]
MLAIRLVNRITKDTSLKLNLAAIFTYKNIENLAHYLKTNTKEDIIITTYTVPRIEDQLLSFAQERLWFIEKYEQGTNAYNIPIISRLADNTLIPSLIKAINSIVKRHEILRTFIREDNEGNSYQLVSDLTSNYIEEIKVNSIDELNERLFQDTNHIYNLSNEYPIRVKIYKLGNSLNHYLSIVIHHIAFDGWSTDIFLKELEEHYQYYKIPQATRINLPELTIQYKDFALWQRSYLTGEMLDKQLTYWKSKLEGYENLNLLTDYPRPLELDYKGKNIYVEFDKELSISLRKVARELGVSLYSLLLSAYYLMLKSYTNQDDIVVGTPVANRHYSQIEHLIGFFVNTLALRVNIDKSSKLAEFIKHVGSEVISAQIHQDLPFEKLVDELRVEKDISRHPIFQVMFGVQSFGSNTNSKHNEDSILRPYINEDKDYCIAKFDLETFIDDSEEVLRGSFNYRVNLYKEDSIRRFIGTYTEILKQIGTILQDRKLKIKDLRYLSKEDEELVLRK